MKSNNWIWIIGTIVVIMTITQTPKIGTEAVGDLLPGGVYTIDSLQLSLNTFGDFYYQISGTGVPSTSNIDLKFIKLGGGGYSSGQVIMIDSTGHYSHSGAIQRINVPDGSPITFGNIQIGIVNVASATQTFNNIVCQNGACSQSSTCTNECTSGTKECYGSGYRTCGNYDADSCTEWSSITNCQSNYYCSSGNCIISGGAGCTDSDGGLNYDVVGIVRWTNPVTGTESILTDNCYSTNSIREYYCTTSGWSTSFHSCQSSYICQNGACVVCTPSRPSNTCGNDNCGNYYDSCSIGYTCQSGMCTRVITSCSIKGDGGTCNVITDSEINSIIGYWKTSSGVSDSEINTAINLWKRG